MIKKAELTKLGAIIMEKRAGLDNFRSSLVSELMTKLAQPTPAQAEAGNYKKKHIRYNGMEISIENPAGSVRSGKSPDGKEWKSKMYHHYGYIRGTQGRDKDHIDVFIKPGTTETEKVFVINQVNKDGSFDEHKCMLGFDNKDEAIKAYLKNYEKGWKVGPTVSMTIFNFKKWVYKGRKIKQAETELKKEANMQMPIMPQQQLLQPDMIKTPPSINSTPQAPPPHVQDITPGPTKTAAYNKGFVDEFKRLTGIEKIAVRPSILERILNPLGNTNRMTAAVDLIKKRGLERAGSRLKTLESRASQATAERAANIKRFLSNERTVERTAKPGFLERNTGIGRIGRENKQRMSLFDREQISSNLSRLQRRESRYQKAIGLEKKLAPRNVEAVNQRYSRSMTGIRARRVGNIAARTAIVGAGGYVGMKGYGAYKNRQQGNYYQ